MSPDMELAQQMSAAMLGVGGGYFDYEHYHPHPPPLSPPNPDFVHVVSPQSPQSPPQQAQPFPHSSLPTEVSPSTPPPRIQLAGRSATQDSACQTAEGGFHILAVPPTPLLQHAHASTSTALTRHDYAHSMESGPTRVEQYNEHINPTYTNIPSSQISSDNNAQSWYLTHQEFYQPGRPGTGFQDDIDAESDISSPVPPYSERDHSRDSLGIGNHIWDPTAASVGEWELFSPHLYPYRQIPTDGSTPGITPQPISEHISIPTNTTTMSSTTTTVTSTDGSVAFMDGHRQLQQGQQSRLSYRLSQVPYFRQSMISEAPPTISATLSAPFEHAFDTPTFLTTPELTLVSPASTHEVEPQSGTMEQSNNSNNAMTSPTDPAFLGVIREEPRVDADGVSVLDYEGLSTSSSHQSSSNSPGGRSRTGSARMHSGYHSHHASSSATRMLPHTTGHSPQSVSSVSSRGTNSSEERRRAARSATQRIGNLFKRSKSATRGNPQEDGGFLERRSLTPLDIEIAPPPPPKDYPRAPSPHQQLQQEAESSYHHYLQPSPFNPPRQQNPEFLAVGRVSSSLGPGWGEAEFINLGQRRPSTTSSFSEKKGDKKKKKDASKPQNPQVFGVPLKDSIKLAPSKIRISHSGKSTSYRVFPLSVYKCCEFIRSSGTLFYSMLYFSG